VRRLHGTESVKSFMWVNGCPSRETAGKPCGDPEGTPVTGRPLWGTDAAE